MKKLCAHALLVKFLDYPRTRPCTAVSRKQFTPDPKLDFKRLTFNLVKLVFYLSEAAPLHGRIAYRPVVE